MKACLVFIVVANLSFDVAAQSIPNLINYQGQITSPSGSVLQTADYDLTFSIYDSAVGGSQIWGPQRFSGGSGTGFGPKVPVVDGYFNVLLGPVDTQSRSISNAFSNSVRFVELRVGTNAPITPRQQILSVPFAFSSAVASSALNASDSRKLNGLDWGAILDGGEVNPVAVNARLSKGLTSDLQAQIGALAARLDEQSNTISQLRAELSRRFRYLSKVGLEPNFSVPIDADNAGPVLVSVRITAAFYDARYLLAVWHDGIGAPEGHLAKVAVLFEFDQNGKYGFPSFRFDKQGTLTISNTNYDQAEATANYRLEISDIGHNNPL